MPRRLAVLGSPIAHSRSPALHAAAYGVLGLGWAYGRAEVTEAGLPAFLADLGPDWLGLSLTMPLKRAVLPLVAVHDPVVERLGLANTVLLGDRPALFNTDVPAIVEVLGAVPAASAVVLGAGATAASALEALTLLGVEERVVAARDPDRAARALGAAATTVRALDAGLRDEVARAAVVVSTLPGGADGSAVVPPRVEGRLLDVAYDPWPSPLGAAWTRAGGELLHGAEMLLAQAVRQIRLFTGGDQESPLPREPEVVAAMRAAL